MRQRWTRPRTHRSHRGLGAPGGRPQAPPAVAAPSCAHSSVSQTRAALVVAPLRSGRVLSPEGNQRSRLTAPALAATLRLRGQPDDAARRRLLTAAHVSNLERMYYDYPVARPPRHRFVWETHPAAAIGFRRLDCDGLVRRMYVRTQTSWNRGAAQSWAGIGFVCDGCGASAFDPQWRESFVERYVDE
jgi:hypothetical protein